MRDAERGSPADRASPANRESPSVLVTRPEPDGTAFAGVLTARGFRPLVAPLLRIEALPPATAPLDLEDVQALIFTSANGVRAFAARSPRRDLPALAVGDATAREATQAGFLSVRSAAGDVETLANLVTRELDPTDGALLHPAAGALAGDLAGLLQSAGFSLRRAVLYQSLALDSLPEAAERALRDGTLFAATFFSPRTAAHFARLVAAGGLTDSLASCHGLCLSEAVAKALNGLSWRTLCVAQQPNQESLLASLDKITEANRGIDKE